MTPLQNYQFHYNYSQVLRAQQQKMRDLAGEDPRARALRTARGAGRRWRGIPLLWWAAWRRMTRAAL